MKDFWNFCKPYFTSKRIFNNNKITLVENNKVLMKNPQISETFNNYFVNKTEELGIYKWGNVPPDSIDLADRINV